MHFTKHIEIEIKQLVIKAPNFHNAQFGLVLHVTVLEICFFNAAHNGLLVVAQLFQLYFQLVFIQVCPAVAYLQFLDLGFQVTIAIYQICHFIISGWQFQYLFLNAYYHIYNLGMKEQQTYSSKSQHTFAELLNNVYDLIQFQQYTKCQDLLCAALFEDADQQVEIVSLRGYVMGLAKKFKEALSLFDQCLSKKPYHLVSKKRRAMMLEKLGEIEECRRQFQSCLYLQPQSKTIRNKIRRLQSNSAKSYSVSSEDNKFEQKLTIQTQVSSLIPQQAEKPKSQSVKFGNFQIIEITANEESDEHFAIIKQQISKLADKKPKKSILKDSMSASIFKEKTKEKEKDKDKEQTFNHASYAKIENIEQKQIAPKNFHDTQVIKPLKKKAKSVTFKGDTNLEDFN